MMDVLGAGVVPGMSLTAEPGSRPWEQPPQYTTVTEAAKFYMEFMSSPETFITVPKLLDMEMPLLDIAEMTIQQSVMSGKHSVDVGVLMMPIVLELLVTVAKVSGKKFIIREKSAPKLDEEEIRAALESASKMSEQAAPAMPEEQPRGLMGRKE